MNVIHETGVIGRVVRLGFRVINFIDGNVFDGEKIKLNIRIGEKEIPYKETTIKTVFSEGEYHSTVSIINQARLNNSTPIRIGSVIDVDTFSVTCERFFDNASEFLEDIHKSEKKVFFSLLTNQFLESLQPEYE